MIKQGEITQLLAEANQGNISAYNKVFPVIYTELRNIAHRIRFQFYGIQTLNTTAIVHEAYLKIVRNDTDWKSRSHFYGVAAKAMRQVLLNAARGKNTAKRGASSEHVCIDDWQEQIDLSEKCSKELILLDEVLKQLEQKDQRQVKIVECRFFANMSVDETADILNISPSTVKRNWQTTKAWLYSQMQHQT
ncbi:ECF-type sigma factor [Reichenbachiella ulvae]|uniref:ECF-type sigma factor n=1 Tax=Reichenbachiella ulvae TaxID=2980104 RepID=A0ABT3CUA2_9BACT|nr:ECF-type sigma factor [Reichenbachiella ulvae]MCV9387099.1 ECF-type sigma factor [Reichenbachiella ulvae]